MVLPPVVVSLVALPSVGGVGRPAQLVDTVRVTAAPPPAQGAQCDIQGASALHSGKLGGLIKKIKLCIIVNKL